MSSKPSKVRTHFYSVAVKTPRGKKKDLTTDTEKMMDSIRELALEKRVSTHVKLKKDDESLAKLGIFFMNAPERFAEEVKTIPGIKYVEKPPARTIKKSRRR